MLTLILITTNGWNKRRYSTKKIYIWNRVRLTWRVKKIILNQILFSQLWYIGQIYTIPKYVKKGIGRGKICTISSGTGKNTTSQTPNATLHLEGWNRQFNYWHAIKLYKNKMDSKVIKSHECSLERSHAVLIKFNSEIWSRPGTF